MLNCEALEALLLMSGTMQAFPLSLLLLDWILEGQLDERERERERKRGEEKEKEGEGERERERRRRRRRRRRGEGEGEKYYKGRGQVIISCIHMNS